MPEDKTIEATQFEAVWARFKPLADGAVTIKEIAELFYLKGLCDGKDQVLQTLQPAVDSIIGNKSARAL